MLQQSNHEFYPLETVLEKHKPKGLNLKKPADRKKFEEICKSEEWTGEEKKDGISAFSIGGRLFTIRDSKTTGYPTEKTAHVPQVSDILKRFGDKLILDGELYKIGCKSYDVCSIVNSEVSVSIAKQQERGPVTYVVYDILQDADGKELMNMPFRTRRNYLKNWYDTLSDTEKQFITLNENWDLVGNDVEGILEDIVANGGEGLVLKNKNFKYKPGSRAGKDMIKLKANMDDDVVIVGFNPPKKEFTGKNPTYFEGDVAVSKFYALGWIGTIEIGKYDNNGTLVSVGRVSGISDKVREDMTNHPEKYIGQVCRISAMEATEAGNYRHANYKGLHEDKNPRDCKIEE